MKKIKMYLDPILYLMEDASEFASRYYIDLEKGDVISPDIDDDIRFDLVEQDARYFYLEPLTSHQGYDIMQDFASSQASEDIRDLLYDALEKKKPFRNFKNTLADFTDIEKQFYEYKNSRLKEILKKRLEEIGYALEEKRYPEA